MEPIRYIGRLYPKALKTLIAINTEDLEDKEIIIDKKGKRKEVEVYTTPKNVLITPMPNMLTREVVYIAGPSGSGKSTYCGQYMAEFKRQFPEAKIFVFSRVKEDKVIDKIGVHRIDIDSTLESDPIDIFSDFNDGDLVLFDDCDTIQDLKLRTAIVRIKNDILETGRHRNLYILVTSHLINPNEKKEGRIILNEMTSITVFPKSGSAYQIKYVLKQYYGFSNDQIDNIFKLNTRWVTLYKNAPQTIMYQRGCYFPV